MLFYGEKVRKYFLGHNFFLWSGQTDPFYTAGLQKSNFEIGRMGGQQMLGAFFAFLSVIYGKDCRPCLFGSS